MPLNTRREDGFTLVEIMVVILVIAILVGIAIPTFLGGRETAQDRAAQSSLRISLAAAKVAFADRHRYSDANPTELSVLEPGLTFVDGTTESGGQNSISVEPVSDDVWVAAVRSKSGTCFALKDNVFGDGTTYARYDSATCKGQHAAVAATFSSTGWTSG